MRCRHPGQQQPPGDLVPDHRQKNHQKARQLNPFIRRRLPAPRAYRTLWKYSQTAMLAIHGDLASLPNGDTAPAAKIVPPGKSRAYWSDVQAPPNERPLPEWRMHLSIAPILRFRLCQAAHCSKSPSTAGCPPPCANIAYRDQSVAYAAAMRRNRRMNGGLWQT
jgi:hypothetical protein